MKMDLQENELVIKKVQSILVVIGLVFSFIACGNPEPPKTVSNEVSEQNAQTKFMAQATIEKQGEILSYIKNATE